MTRISLEGTALEADAGGEATCTAKVTNTSSVVERYTLQVLGEPGNWAQLEPPVISLLPGDERAVSVTFRPPRDPSIAAASYPFAVKAIPTEQPDDTAVEEGDVTVRPFRDLAATLRPGISRGARVGHHVLRLGNHGNRPVEASVTATDPGEILSFRVRPPTARVEPGATVPVRVDVRPRTTSMFGPTQQHPFKLSVKPDDAAPVVVDGVFLQRPLSPRWVPRVAAALGVLLVGAALYAHQLGQVKNVASIVTATTIAGVPGSGAAAVGGGSTPSTGATQGTPDPGSTTASGSGTTLASGTTLGTVATASASALEPGVTTADLACSSYSPTHVSESATAPTATTQSPSTTATVSTAAASSRSAPTYTVSTGNPTLTFVFANQPDADAAVFILKQYSESCQIGSGSIVPGPVMTLEPYLRSGPPPVPSPYTEHCTPYTASALVVGHDFRGDFVKDSSLPADPSTPSFTEYVVDNQAAAVVLSLAKAHSERCWIGGGSTFTSINGSTDGTQIIEYWR